MVVDTADGQGEEIGWARVLSGAENCGFCAMLASRGPVYRSAETAQHRGANQHEDKFHDHCDCAVVLVHKGRDWEGREQYETLEDLWGEVAYGGPEHYSGNAARRAFRRAIERGKREDLSFDELLDTIRAENAAAAAAP